MTIPPEIKQQFHELVERLINSDTEQTIESLTQVLSELTDKELTEMYMVVTVLNVAIHMTGKERGLA